MYEGKQSLRRREVHLVAEVDDIVHLECSVVRLVSFTAGAHFVVQFGRLDWAQKGGVTVRNADSVIYTKV